MSTKEAFMISVDWFQYYCLSNNKYPLIGCFYSSGQKNEKGYVSQYEIKGCKQFIPSYRQSMGVYLHGFLLAIIGFHPANSKIRPDGCAIKVANRVLYQSNWSFFVHDILRALGWSVVSITRVDLAYDCNYFANHLHPQMLIQSYLSPQVAGLEASSSDVVVKTKSNIEKTVNLAHRSFIRHGSNRFHVEGVKALHFPIFEYIRFGSRRSAVCVYLYNKSQELRVQQDKPYIRECWELAGLESSDVYRVELSISSAGTFLTDKKHKQKRSEVVVERPGLVKNAEMKLPKLDHLAFVRLDGESIATQARLEEMFYSYASEYFRFHIDTGQAKVKDMPVVKLFECSYDIMLKPVSANRFVDSGRTEKIVSNSLDDYIDKCPWLGPSDKKLLADARDLFYRISNIKRTSREQMSKREDLVELFLRRDDVRSEFDALFARYDGDMTKDMYLSYCSSMWDRYMLG